MNESKLLKVFKVGNKYIVTTIEVYDEVINKTNKDEESVLLLLQLEYADQYIELENKVGYSIKHHDDGTKYYITVFKFEDDEIIFLYELPMHYSGNGKVDQGVSSLFKSLLSDLPLFAPIMKVIEFGKGGC